jgi:predicted PurR-regulated permease PerM
VNLGEKKVCLAFFLGLAFLLLSIPSFAQEAGFTQEDRERLIRLEATLKVFMEQVDKRFAELREDMNKRFEQIDKRFEQVDKRFEQMMTFLWMLVAIFTTLTAVVIGFAYWDRRTIIRQARDEAIEAIEKEGKLTDLINALRKLASENKKLADVLRSFGLL